MEQQIKEIIKQLGYNPEDPNFKDTPSRVVKALKYATRGEQIEGGKAQNHFEKKFPTTYNGMVVQKGIKTMGLCPHHLKDIEYEISFGIIYSKEALGLSKITRVLEELSARAVLQETLTSDIIKAFTENLAPKGVAVIVKGYHGCMSTRGVKQRIPTFTTELTGPFKNEPECREEFYHIINNN